MTEKKDAKQELTEERVREIVREELAKEAAIQFQHTKYLVHAIQGGLEEKQPNA